MAIRVILLVLSFFIVQILAQDLQHIKLQPWRVNRKKVTLSGFSSGGTFAQQMQFSHARLFTGIAVFSHTYYGCGFSDGIEENYDRVCTVLGNVSRELYYDPKLAIQKIEQWSKENLIDNPMHLMNKKLYVYTGLRNEFFTPEQSLRIVQIYEPYIRNPALIRTRVQDATMLFPTDNYGFSCATNARNTFFLGNCNFSGAVESLQFLLGDEIVKPRGKLNLRRLSTFDQTEFFTQEPHGMDTVGFVYIPRACGSRPERRSRMSSGESNTMGGRRHQDRECLLHFYFHGCLVSRGHVGMNHTMYSGFLEVAEQNNIIVVFPQVQKGEPGKKNEIACWDTYGYNSDLHATRRGAQIQIVRRMLDRIMGPDIHFNEGGVRPPAPTASRHPDRNFQTKRPLAP